jgi:hypothetical protein
MSREMNLVVPGRRASAQRNPEPSVFALKALDFRIRGNDGKEDCRSAVMAENQG